MPQETRKEIRVEDYFWTVWRSKFSIFIIFFVAIMTAFVKNDVSPPVYEAKNRIWIKEEQDRMPGFEDFLLGSSLGRATRIETLKEILKSRHIVAQTVEELELDKNPLPKHRGKIISGLAGILGIELKDQVYDKYTEDVLHYQNELKKLVGDSRDRDATLQADDIEKCLSEIKKSEKEIAKIREELEEILDKNHKDLDDYEKSFLVQIKRTSRKLALQSSELISYQTQTGLELYQSESPNLDKYLPKIEKNESAISEATSRLESQAESIEKEMYRLKDQKTKLINRRRTILSNDEEIRKIIGQDITNKIDSIEKRIEVLGSVAKYAQQIVVSAEGLLENRENLDQFEKQEPELALDILEAFSVITESQRLRKRKCIEDLRENFSVKPIRETNIIEISVKNGNPDRAQEIANAIAKNFKNYMREDMQAQMTATTDFAGDKAAEIKTKLEEAENELARYQHENNMVDLEIEAEMIITNLEKFKAGLTNVKERKAGSESKLENFLQQLKGIDEKVVSSETLTDNPILTALRQNWINNKVQLAELTDKYPTGEHAEISRLEAKIKEQREEIDRLEKNIISKTTTLNPIHQQLSSDIIQTQAQIDATNAQEIVLQNRISEYKQILKEMPEKQVELAKKKRDVALYQKLLTSLQETKQEADIFKEAEVGSVKELDKAYEPDKPISPRKKINLLLGALIGMSLGIGLAFLGDAIDNKYHTIEEAQKDFEVLSTAPVYLGLIPPIGGDGSRSDDTSVPLMSNLSRQGDNVLEAFRLMRTKLQFLRTSSELKTMVVTSSVPGEGKTTIAVNSAISLERMEKKVLLIDADLRKPRLHRAFKTSRLSAGDEPPTLRKDSQDNKLLVEYESGGSDKKPGLSELLLEIGHGGNIEELTKQIIRTIEDHENIHLIPSGTKPPEPSQLLGSDSMEELLKYLKEQYDYIVIDSPPAGFADPMVLSEKVDCVLYVLDLTKAKKPEVRHGLENLIEIASAPSTEIVSGPSVPIAVICNWAEMPSIGYYYGYYYGGYYGYYRYKYGYYGSYYYDYYEDKEEKKRIGRLKRFLFGNKRKRLTSKDEQGKRR